MAPVRDAVILAAGVGSRMAPATLATPKEALPLLDVPLIIHVVAEAAAAGVDRIHLVLSKGKEHLFDVAKGTTDAKQRLMGKRTELSEWMFQPAQKAEVIMYIQEHPLGVGDAISQAIVSIDGPFIVLMADNALIEKNKVSNQWEPSTASKHLVEKWMENGRPVLGLVEVPDSIIHRYGVVEMDGEKVVQIIEKPTREEAPSRLVACGRYLFPGGAREVFDSHPLDIHGEMQSVEVLRSYSSQKGGLIGLNLDRYALYDSGDPMGWLLDQMHHASQREDVCDELMRGIERIRHRIVNIRVEALRPHEEIRPARLKKMVKKITTSGVIHKPLLVDQASLTILDGHHRYNAAIELGLNWVPSILVDYVGDHTIKVDVWPECGKVAISKEEVVAMGLSEELFPPKTSRHILSQKLPSLKVNLGTLR
ncbi:MAG: hypothetical protein CL992_01030 [Euryarchaeota archaeon]|nr:hypothetical protein [Euryarchaeota archaeon]